MIKDNAVSLYWECPQSPYPFHTARTLASLYSFPSWQCSQHPSPSQGLSWHAPMVAVWDSTFPHPFVLPSTLHLSTTMSIPGCPGAEEFPAQDSHSLISGAVSATHTRAEHHEAAPL